MTSALDGVQVAWATVPPGAERRAVAWSLVRDLLGSAGAGARLSNACPLCGGPHGPVRIDGAPFLAGVSYAGERAVAGIIGSGEAASFAIDAERADAEAPSGVLGQGTSIRDWVRIEAALKADGRGLRVDPSIVEILADGSEWLARIPGRAEPLRGRDVAAPPGILISVASDAIRPASEERDGPATTRAAP